MLSYLILFLLPFISIIQSIAQKQYNLKSKSPNSGLFSAVTSLIALIFFIVTSGFQLSFTVKLIPYALVFGVCYASAWVGTVEAVRHGTITLTNMIISCSLVIPTTYGIVRGETVTPVTVIGMDTYEDAFEALLNEASTEAIPSADDALVPVDAVLISGLVASYNITANEALAGYSVIANLSEDPIGIAFAKGNYKLCGAVEEALYDLAQEGVLAAITTEWFGSDISLIGK